MRKKVDDRIRTLIEHGVKAGHRSMFVIIGDKSRDQIVNLHYMLSKSVVKARPSVLWCYKEKLELSSHKKKRVKQVKKMMQRGLLDPEKVDPFSLFIESGVVSHCLYRDSERILGNTYGMCILQDFEALTPNILARTIETVEGGGLVVLLLRSLSSLTSLCTVVMDNKSFSEAQEELKKLKGQLHDVLPVGPLVSACTTLDQMMARHAREIEKGESSPSEGSELDEQIPNEMHLVERDTVEGLKDSIWSDVLEKQASNVLSFIGEDVSEEHVEGDMNLTNNVLSEESAEVSGGGMDVGPHSISNGRISGHSKTQSTMVTIDLNVEPVVGEGTIVNSTTPTTSCPGMCFESGLEFSEFYHRYAYMTGFELFVIGNRIKKEYKDKGILKPNKYNFYAKPTMASASRHNGHNYNINIEHCLHAGHEFDTIDLGNVDISDDLLYGMEKSDLSLCRSMLALEHKEHTHFDVVRSTDPTLRKAITQINIFKEHRQIVQYVEPQYHVRVSQADLLIIDEAAAIPLPVVKSLLGPYLVFLSSTVNGYEGTGRSLSLKLLSHLEKQSHSPATGVISGHSGSSLFTFCRGILKKDVFVLYLFPLEKLLLGWINVICDSALLILKKYLGVTLKNLPFYLNVTSNLDLSFACLLTS
ncbi:RNA cytidine acetyltransferase 1-like [Spinacia oleracea]|uniref:RNA cytidine acetyltransferase 1-like n=1 Tax=Spinacia oleracea TaxID=3562 RepID=A0ABM3QWU1_SPIOL|nr:RNA cytidine acetyltransferase 1-like [Spinacia oleracea]